MFRKLAQLDLGGLDLPLSNEVTGAPLDVSVHLLDENPGNPRTEFVDADIEELANDIRERGILQPIVVSAADAQGRYRIRYGAKRLRAAKRAGLSTIPVVVATTSWDAYSQVAENQKRQGLTPLDLARFIQSRVDAGESNATIARKLVMDLTSVAHHLALLSLPPVLDAALKAGRCTSPRTLHELSRLYGEHPEDVAAVLSGAEVITRNDVVTLKENVMVTGADRAATNTRPRGATSRVASATLLQQANRLCDRLESLLQRTSKQRTQADHDALATLRQRLVAIAAHD